MEILYKAFDGKIFTDEYECEKYEAINYTHMDIYGLTFLDKDDNEIVLGDDPFDDDIYGKAETVIIHNEAEADDLFWLAKECGWIEFEDIDSPGTWKRFVIDDYGVGVWEKQ